MAWVDWNTSGTSVTSTALDSLAFLVLTFRNRNSCCFCFLNRSCVYLCDDQVRLIDIYLSLQVFINSLCRELNLPSASLTLNLNGESLNPCNISPSQPHSMASFLCALTMTQHLTQDIHAGKLSIQPKHAGFCQSWWPSFTNSPDYYVPSRDTVIQQVINTVAISP